MTKYLLIMLGLWTVAVWLLVNAIFAIRSPAKYLTTPWTIRRGLRPESSNWDVRLLGAAALLVGAFFLFGASMITLAILADPNGVTEADSSPQEAARGDGGMWRYLFEGFWCLATLGCLFSGIFAVVSPAKWQRSRWAGVRMPGVDSPGRVRFMGALMLVMGAFFTFLGVRIVTSNLLR